MGIQIFSKSQQSVNKLTRITKHGRQLAWKFLALQALGRHSLVTSSRSQRRRFRIRKVLINVRLELLGRLLTGLRIGRRIREEGGWVGHVDGAIGRGAAVIHG